MTKISCAIFFLWLTSNVAFSETWGPPHKVVIGTVVELDDGGRISVSYGDGFPPKALTIQFLLPRIGDRIDDLRGILIGTTVLCGLYPSRGFSVSHEGICYARVSCSGETLCTQFVEISRMTRNLGDE